MRLLYLKKAQDALNEIKSRNGAPPPNYKGGRTFNNQPVDGGQKLPDNVNYKEYDVNPFVKGQGRGTERIVIGDDGQHGIRMTITRHLLKWNN